MKTQKNGKGCTFPGLALTLVFILAIPVVPVVAGKQILATLGITPTSPNDGSNPPNLEPTSILDYPASTQDRPPCYKTPLQLRPEDHYWFDRPIPSNYVNWINTDYRYGGTYYDEYKPHSGADISAGNKTPVIAAADGVVNWAGMGLFGHYPNKDDPYGNAVSIRHDFGYRGQPVFTVYAHLSQIDVEIGQQVKAGDVIGLIGMTGKATGPHLHFEVRIGEDSFYNTRNPELWLVPPEGYGVLAGRIETTDSWPMDGYPFTLTQLEKGPEYRLQTYIGNITNPDDIYQENFVVSDLPAGTYLIDTWVWWEHYYFTVDIAPGQTTFVVIHSGLSPLINPPLVY